ncbi:hypothetical protein HMY34_07450 [Thiothrix subterranea]|uniref:hypothetical protein n=1 Tax=Thiothrix subterranea TaxID=2735563 RepID=UPI00192AC351|nr:hypothetical protein [Thiothrix subterranea]QQZ28601.1 hypothetical protein HMY34_07450 [Thiothrix subterranea]
MIYEFNKIMRAVVANLINASAVILLVLFYALSVLQLPVPEVANMLGVLIVFAFGINIILSFDKTTALPH